MAHPLLQTTKSIGSQLSDLRRLFHQYPELGYEEVNTAKRLSEYLEKAGLEVRRPSGTMVVGILKGDHPGKTVVIRSDMDALAIQEVQGREYGSRVPGVMHACGHDGHMAILLGTATVLRELRSELRGEVRFVFQPAEEKLPKGGAKALIEAGVLDNPPADMALGLHLWPELPSGRIAVHAGTVMAAGDVFQVTFRGRGGHGARPDQADDVVLCASHTVVALHTIVSRDVDAATPAVLSVGTIHGGQSPNIIPSEITLSGTVRCLNESSRRILKKRIEEVTQRMAAAYHCRAHVDYQTGYPAVVNDHAVAEAVAKAAAKILGPAAVARDLPPSMASEDFSFFGQEVPSCYFWLGTKNKRKGTHHPLHSSEFDLDEDVLAIGVAILAQVCLDSLA